MPHACQACRKPPAPMCFQAHFALHSNWAHPAAGRCNATYLDGIGKGHDVDMVRLLSHGLHKATTEGLHAQQIITHALQGRLNSCGCPWQQPCSSTSATALAILIASGQAAWPASP